MNRVPYTDHKGVTHPSFLHMCRAWGWTYPSIVRQRLSLLWSLEDALTRPEGPSYSYRVLDHQGRQHASRRAMALWWGKNPWTVDKRIAKGWTLEDALTKANVRAGRLGDLRGVAWGRAVLDRWAARRQWDAA